MKIHLPPHAIWFQSTQAHQAAISVVNNLYRYEIFDKVTGERIVMGSLDTLSKAKKIVRGMI